MKISKVFLIDVVLVLIAFGVYYYYSGKNQASTPPVAEKSQAQKEISWSYEDMGTNEET